MARHPQQGSSLQLPDFPESSFPHIINLKENISFHFLNYLRIEVFHSCIMGSSPQNHLHLKKS